MKQIQYAALTPDELTSLISNKESFEIVGLRGSFNAGIKMVESKIESLGMKCRVKSDLKSAVMQGGAAGALIGLVSAPATLTVAAVTVVAGVGHTLATYDPDYEVLKDLVNKRLRVIYKK